MQGRVPELLAPAGGPAEFNAALAAGADAIYCGYGQVFNARRGAQSFDAHTFGEACRKAHVAGACVYVTVNVVIRDDELPSVLGLIRRAWLLGADAFIIQDWGLLREVRRLWPNIECHVSTQANVHDARGVLWCQEMGVARVTLSRELSLSEIAHMARTGMELECFAHGAICFCYSGLCMMSSCAGDRSANRGMCAQPCRLPYELVDEAGRAISSADRGRPLCPKDMCTLDDVAAMSEAGVSSLKIEGRLKGADYVYAVVGAYRAQLDDVRDGRSVPESESAKRHTSLKRSFNRDFTDAYLKGTSGDELMSYERSNNRGELVGTVVGSRSLGTVKVRRGGGRGGRDRLRTTRIAEVDARVSKFVGKGDLLEFRPIDDPSQFVTAHAPCDAKEGDVLCCRVPRAVQKGSLVRVIRSHAAMQAGARAAELEIPARRPIDVSVVMRLGKRLEVTLRTADGRALARASAGLVEPARTRAVTKEDVVKHVGRMGGTPFDPASFDVDMDEGCGISFSALHGVRQQACEALERTILAPYESRELSQPLAFSAPNPELTARPRVEVCALVANAQSAEAARKAGATRIYATTDALAHGSWQPDVIPVLDEVCREADHERLDVWVASERAVAVGNVSELALAARRGARAEVRGCIPVHNMACLNTLVQRGASGVWLTPELSLDEVARLAAVPTVPMGLMVYGRVRAMTSEHCVLQVAQACTGDCARCKLRERELFLKSCGSDLLPVRTDLQGRSRIYSARILDATPQVPELLEAGVTWFGADCTLLSADDTEQAVRRVAMSVDASLNGRHPKKRARGATSGHLFALIA